MMVYKTKQNSFLTLKIESAFPVGNLFGVSLIKCDWVKKDVQKHGVKGSTLKKRRVAEACSGSRREKKIEIAKFIWF